jgi:hypothetical protein
MMGGIPRGGKNLVEILLEKEFQKFWDADGTSRSNPAAAPRCLNGAKRRHPPTAKKKGVILPKHCMCISKYVDLPLFDVDGMNEKMIESIAKACL